MPDGLFGTDADGAAVFHRLPPPTEYDVEQLLHTTARRVQRMLAKKVGDGDHLDTDEALGALEAASLIILSPSEPTVP